MEEGMKVHLTSVLYLLPVHPHRYATSVLRGSRDLNPAEHSVFGAIAGSFTGLVTTPLDVLKTRLMLQGGRGGQYKGPIDCARQIIQQEGGAALFRGWQPRVLWIGIGGSIFFTVLEQAKKFYAPPPPPPTPLKACCSGKKRDEKKK
jgi:hypothetical protein